jgi:hypothetical protein
MNSIPIETDAGEPGVFRECSVCAKFVYIYWLWTSADAFGWAIYNTAL